MHVVSFSTGLGSAEALRRTVLKVGVEHTVAVFADVGAEYDEEGRQVSGEEADQFRFMADLEKALGVIVHRLRHPEYRSIWDLFERQRLLGGLQRDPCSQILKRFLIDDWIAAHWTPETCVLVSGLGWLEKDWAERWQTAQQPWSVWLPNCAKPYWTNEEIAANLESQYGVRPPISYAQGLSANCLGFCVKMNLWQAYLLWRERLPVYQYAARREEAFRQRFQSAATIMESWQGGVRQTWTLAELADRFAQGIIPLELAGEGCAGRCLSLSLPRPGTPIVHHGKPLI